MFKVLFQHLRGTLTTAFERHLAVENGSRYVQILFLGGYHETKMDAGDQKTISCTNV